MPHVVDRNAVKQVDLGLCGQDNCQIPHWVKLSLRYSYMDKMGLADAAGQGVEAMARYRFLKRVKDWNLVDLAGKKLPVTHRSLDDINEQTADAIWEAINELDDADEDADDLPNP